MIKSVENIMTNVPNPAWSLFYGLAIEQDLLDEWLVRRAWGGMGKPTGQSGRRTIYDCIEAENPIAALALDVLFSEKVFG